MKKRNITLFTAIAAAAAFAPTAHAAIIAPLDGETVYRVIFKYSTAMPNTSTDIAVYNTLLDAEGDAELVSTWRAVASTPTVDARDNTSTTATDGLAASGDVPIYNTKGEFVWSGNAAMWNGQVTQQGTYNTPGDQSSGVAGGLILTMAGSSGVAHRRLAAKLDGNERRWYRKRWIRNGVSTGTARDECKPVAHEWRNMDEFRHGLERDRDEHVWPIRRDRCRRPRANLDESPGSQRIGSAATPPRISDRFQTDRQKIQAAPDVFRGGFFIATIPRHTYPPTDLSGLV